MSKKKSNKPVVMQGTFCANAKGFGFVAVDDLEQDLFIPEGRTGTALDGDLVEATLLPTFDGNVVPGGKDGRRQEAEITAILTRNTTSIVGTFYGDGTSGSVIPDNRKITADVRIPAGSTKGAVNGHKVVVRITDYGETELEKHKASGKSFRHFTAPALTGEVDEILGHMDDPGVDILSIMRAYNLPQRFPDEVMDEVREIPQVIPIDENKISSAANSDVHQMDDIGTPDERDAAEKGGECRESALENSFWREDWRDVLTVTIDGPDTKDIDDAISIRRIIHRAEKGKALGENSAKRSEKSAAAWELGVHIADVAQYVHEGTALDKEALKRATSNYLVDRVIPMLPHELSNGICSLNPGEDRFALSCIMQMDKAGRVIEARVVETIIRSDAKLSYPGVMCLLNDGDESEILHQLELQGIKRGAKTKAHAIAAMLRRGLRLSGILSKKRTADGAIDFEFPECKIHLDEEGHVTDIAAYERNAATMMIENFMVAANETVAEHFYWLGVPFVYRTHGVPDEEKMQNLRRFVQGYGFRLNWKQGNVHPKELQTLLASLKGKPEEATVSVMTLRSMQRAMYTTTCGGHFGLALRYYCHFTSPIRRYPDLQIHRIIKEYLHGKLNQKRRSHYDSILPNVCLQSSNMERRADEAERETNKQKMCEYMKGHVGEVFDGSVSGVTGWGIYVQLPNTVEGLVPARSMRDDYYNYVEEKALLVGERTGKSYGLGQPVRVLAASVDTMARTIDFELYSEETEGNSNGKSDGKGRKKEKPTGKKKKKIKKLTRSGQQADPKSRGSKAPKEETPADEGQNETAETAGIESETSRHQKSGHPKSNHPKSNHPKSNHQKSGKHNERKRNRRKHHAGEHQTDREQ